MRNRKEVVNELFQLRLELALLKRGDLEERQKLERKVDSIRTEIKQIDRNNCLKERGRKK